MAELEARSDLASKGNYLMTQMIGVVKNATNWAKKGSVATGIISGGSISLEKKGGDTIRVIIKGPRGHEKARVCFGYKETIFGKKYNEVMGC